MRKLSYLLGLLLLHSTMVQAAGVTLISPTSGTQLNTRDSVTLSWNAVSGSTVYRYVISSTPNFALVFVDEKNTSYCSDNVNCYTGDTRHDPSLTSVTISNAQFQLQPDTTYYWKVRTNAQDVLDWSATWQFTTPPEIFNLSIQTTGSGTGTVTGADEYEQGSSATLVASPDNNSTFLNWSGDCSGSNPNYSLTIDANKNCTAEFALKTYPVTTSITNGRFEPENIQVTHGQKTSFSIIPNNGYMINNVSGCNGTLSGNTYSTGIITNDCTIIASLIANIAPTHQVSTLTIGTGAGTISGAGEYEQDSLVTLTALPNNNSIFVNWSGDCSGSNPNYSLTIDANKSCTAEFALKTYPVTTSITNGRFEPENVQVTHGQKTSFSIIPNDGYTIDNITGCNGTLNGTIYNTGIITNSCAISASLIATVVPTQRVITQTIGTGAGSITGAGEYEQGKSVNLTALPEANSTFTQWSGDCSGTHSTYALVVNADKNCVAEFTLKKYSIETSIQGGRFEPTNAQVAHGTTTSFSIIPDAGYVIERVTGCNGTLNGTLYTTDQMTANCTISASLKANAYSITTTHTGNGRIEPSVLALEHEETAQFSLIPNTGYEVESATGCNGSISGNQYVIQPITKSCEIQAVFKPKQYNVTVAQLEHGSIEPNAVTLNHGATKQFTLKPEIGYELESIQGCNGTVSSQGAFYEIPALQGHCQISASFARKQYTVNITSIPSEAGAINIDSPVQIQHGENIRFTITPATNYQINEVEGCEVTLEEENRYITNAITHHCDITVVFVDESGEVPFTPIVLPEKTQARPINTIVLITPLAGEAVLWESLNPTVASVDQQGLVTRLNLGTTQIVAHDAQGNSSATTVFVKEVIELPKITPPKPGDGESVVQIKPLSGQAVHWESRDPDIASVDQQGVVTWKQPGETQIVAYDADDNQSEMTVTVEPPPVTAPNSLGQAIIIAAGSNDDSLHDFSQQYSEDVYRTLKKRGFTDEEIHFFSVDPPNIDLKNNDHPEVELHDYGLSDPEQELQTAFNKVANILGDEQQFILYLHGFAEEANLFKLTNNYHLSTDKLKSLLELISPNSTQIIIVDTAYSGSVISQLSAPNRVIITGTDESSGYWNAKTMSFSQLLFFHLERDARLIDAYEDSKREFQRSGKRQSPMIEGAKRFTSKELGIQSVSAAYPIRFTQVSERIILTDSNQALLHATLDLPESFKDEAYRVSVLLLPPDYVSSNDDFDLASRKLTKLKLNYNAKTNRYEANYKQFEQQGQWTLLFEVQSVRGYRDRYMVELFKSVDELAPVLTEPSAMFEVKSRLNQFAYEWGDMLRFSMQTKRLQPAEVKDEDDKIDSYALLLLPEGLGFISFDKTKAVFSNEAKPYKTFSLTEQTEYHHVYDFILPELPPEVSGIYYACGLLAFANSDVMDVNNWISYQCEPFMVQ